uniref:Uncharacterized protein n=1 Tax=Arundo donax TaxID=35708 RepID=A0A0A9F106_ARUDO
MGLFTSITIVLGFKNVNKQKHETQQNIVCIPLFSNHQLTFSEDPH